MRVLIAGVLFYLPPPTHSYSDPSKHTPTPPPVKEHAVPLQAIPPLPPRAVSEESVNGPPFQVVEPPVPFFRHQSVVHDREYLLAQIGQMSVIEAQLAAERDQLRA